MSYDVDITRCGISALFDCKGRAEDMAQWLGGGLPALPDMANRKSNRDNVDLFHIGPGHWILRAPIEQESSLTDRLQPETCPPDISIVQVSDTLTFFRVTGPEAAEIMAIACPLDLHPSVFGADAVTFTEVFGLKGLVMRCENGFEFAVEQSFGTMVQDYLDRATS